MNKQEIYVFLKEKGVEHTVVEHTPAFTVEDIHAIGLPNGEQGAKNLFLRDHKKRNYYLLTMKDDKPVNLKELQAKLGCSRISFASEDDLMKYLGLTKGGVSPFGLLNDEGRVVTFYLDSYYKNDWIWVHPNENTASVYLKAEDLLGMLNEHGTRTQYIDL